MTMEEFKNLKHNDKLYYYTLSPIDVCVRDFNMVIKSFNININHNNIMHIPKFVSIDEARIHKLMEMKKIYKNHNRHDHDIRFLKYKGSTKKMLKIKLDKIMKQKNVLNLITKYPEKFI